MGGGWVVCKPILVLCFGPNQALGHGLRPGPSQRKDGEILSQHSVACITFRNFLYQPLIDTPYYFSSASACFCSQSGSEHNLVFNSNTNWVSWKNFLSWVHFYQILYLSTEYPELLQLNWAELHLLRLNCATLPEAELCYTSRGWAVLTLLRLSCATWA